MMDYLTVFILIVVSGVYMLIGGAVFYALERDNESTTQTIALLYYNNFLNNNTCITDTELQTFVKAVITAYDQGILVLNTTSQWDFANSIFFAMTCVTTIGYGNQSPSTIGGRVFFMFYAIIGIPLIGITLGGVGLKMSILLKKLRRHGWIKKYPKADRLLKFFVRELFGIGILVLLPSIIFSYAESWTFVESMYYCVVSLTTVGFGDFVAGIDESPYRVGYRLFIMIWLLIGLSWVAFIISETSNWYQKFFEKRENKTSHQEDNTKNGEKEVNS